MEPSIVRKALDLASPEQPHCEMGVLVDILHHARVSLRMEVGFISEFCGGRRVFRVVDDDDDFRPVAVGGSDPLDESYCHRVASGTVPELIRDARAEPTVADLAATFAIPVGTHVSIPIVFSDGSVFGTFCCFSRHVDPSLKESDLGALRFMAGCVARFLESSAMEERRLEHLRHRLQALLDDPTPLEIHFQPLLSVASGQVLGYEALARFRTEPYTPPDVWFQQAAEVGLSDALELLAIEKAIDAFFGHPATADAYLSLNLSPKTLKRQADRCRALLAPHGERVLLELTEHIVVQDYQRLNRALAPLRAEGVGVCVDDAGAGYASFRHILLTHPDVIKLDRSLVQGIDQQEDSYQLAKALVDFAHHTGAKVVAEGVETQAEFDAVLELGIDRVQGYFVGKPAPL